MKSVVQIFPLSLLLLLLVVARAVLSANDLYVNTLVLIETGHKQMPDSKLLQLATSYLKNTELLFGEIEKPKVHFRLAGTHTYPRRILDSTAPDKNKSLRIMKKWVAHNFNNTKFDTVIAYVDRKFAGRMPIVGYVNGWSMCQREVALVTLLADPGRIGAHELGHAFGLDHVKASSIMEEVFTGATTTGWSDESKRFLAGIANLYPCLRNGSEKAEIHAQPPGAFLSRTQLCQEKYPHMIFPVQLRPFDCANIECYSKDFLHGRVSNFHGKVDVIPPDGMRCDKNRACYRGRCVSKSEVIRRYGIDWKNPDDGLIKNSEQLYIEMAMLMEYDDSNKSGIIQKEIDDLINLAKVYFIKLQHMFKSSSRPEVILRLITVQSIPKSVTHDHFSFEYYNASDSPISNHMKQSDIRNFHFDLALLFTKREFRSEKMLAAPGGACTPDSRKVGIVSLAASDHLLNAKKAVESLVGDPYKKDPSYQYHLRCLENKVSQKQIIAEPVPSNKMGECQKLIKDKIHVGAKESDFITLAETEVDDCSVTKCKVLHYQGNYPSTMNYNFKKEQSDGTICQTNKMCLHGACVQQSVLSREYGREWKPPLTTPVNRVNVLVAVVRGGDGIKYDRRRISERIISQFIAAQSDLAEMGLDVSLNLFRFKIISLRNLALSADEFKRMGFGALRNRVFRYLKEDPSSKSRDMILLLKETHRTETDSKVSVGGICSDSADNIAVISRKHFFGNTKIVARIFCDIFAACHPKMMRVERKRYQIPCLSGKSGSRIARVKVAPPAAEVNLVDQCESARNTTIEHMYWLTPPIPQSCEKLVCPTLTSWEKQDTNIPTNFLYKPKQMEYEQHVLDGTQCYRNGFCLRGHCTSKRAVLKQYGKNWQPIEQARYCFNVLVIGKKTQDSKHKDALLAIDEPIRIAMQQHKRVQLMKSYKTIEEGEWDLLFPYENADDNERGVETYRRKFDIPSSTIIVAANPGITKKDLDYSYFLWQHRYKGGVCGSQYNNIIINHQRDEKRVVDCLHMMLNPRTEAGFSCSTCSSKKRA